MEPYFKFKLTKLYTKFPFISEEDYLDSNDDCVVTKNKVYYTTMKTSVVSITKGYLKNSVTGNLKGLFDSKSYQKKTYNEIDINNINSIDNISVKSFVKNVLITIEKDISEKEEKKLHLSKLQEQNLEILNNSKISILNEIDKDNDGTVDFIQGDSDFMKLLTKHQSKIIEIDKEYIQNFIKISNVLKIKKTNIQTIYISIKDSTDLSHLRNQVGMLKNQINIYESVLFHSLNMITSLIKNDLITFYEIYEKFDKLNMFNSNWENEISQKLKNIGEGLTQLTFTIEEMGRNIVDGISELTYVTENSNQNLITELKGINSSLGVNNLLTGIQTYQMYKINKNTKGLKG